MSGATAMLGVAPAYPDLADVEAPTGAADPAGGGAATATDSEAEAVAWRLRTRRWIPNQ